MKFLVLWITFGLASFNVLANPTSHLVMDINNKKIVSASNEDTIRPIASITKLMTALVVLESNLDMNEAVTYKGGLFRNKKVKRSELLESLLIRSENAAADALADSVYGGRQAFIDAMNLKALALGMSNTKFVDASGIGRDNISTAKDVSKLIEKTYEHSQISNVSSSKFFKVEIRNKQKITYITVSNTNSRLLDAFDSITLSKTGYTNPAGRCLGMMVEKNNNRYAIVILGEKSVDDRFKQAQRLINMVLE